MKVLHLCRQYHPSVGGVERFVADLAGRLATRGHQVEVATLNRLWRSAKILPKEEVVAGIVVRRLPFVGGALFFCAPTILALAQQFDVLHVHNTDFFLDYLVALRGWHRRPIVVSSHGGYFHTQNQATLKRLYFQLVTRRSLQAATVVIPNSLSDEKRFGRCNRRTMRIDNAIDYLTFARVNRQPVSGRLITVGRLAANKNLEGLLRVFAAAQSQQPELRLVIIGDGLERDTLHSLAQSLNLAEVVEWLGEVDDLTLWAELARAEFFLSAATYEGFGLAVLEAMAVGVIPVVNTIEAFRSFIVDGHNGFLADYTEVVSSSDKLLQAINLTPVEKERLGQQARSTAARYAWDEAIPKFERIYRETLESVRN